MYLDSGLNTIFGIHMLGVVQMFVYRLNVLFNVTSSVCDRQSVGCDSNLTKTVEAVKETVKKLRPQAKCLTSGI